MKKKPNTPFPPKSPNQYIYIYIYISSHAKISKFVSYHFSEAPCSRSFVFKVVTFLPQKEDIALQNLPFLSLKMVKCAACTAFGKPCLDGCATAQVFPLSTSKAYLDVKSVFGHYTLWKYLKAYPDHRPAVASSFVFDAHNRIRDPVNGSWGVYSRLGMRYRALDASYKELKKEYDRLEKEYDRLKATYEPEPPQHNNIEPQHNNIEPQHNNIEPQHNNIEPQAQHNNTEPQHNNTEPQHNIQSQHSTQPLSTQPPHHSTETS